MKTPQIKKAAEFVESCLHDMDMPWTDVVGEILSCLTYGWSLHEIVYKRRMGRKRDPRLESKFDDGLIGWQKLPALKVIRVIPKDGAFSRDVVKIFRHMRRGLLFNNRVI